jgi:hypothetical protein
MKGTDREWVEVMELDDTFVRVYCVCVLAFPLSLLLVGLSKMRALRHSHAAAVATYAAEHEPSVPDVGGGGGVRADRRQITRQESSTTAATSTVAWERRLRLFNRPAQPTTTMQSFSFQPDDTPPRSQMHGLQWRPFQLPATPLLPTPAL